MSTSNKSTDCGRVVLLLCNQYFCYSLAKILYYYQLITHFNPCTIGQQPYSYLYLILPNSTRYHSCYMTGHTCTSKSTDYCDYHNSTNNICVRNFHHFGWDEIGNIGIMVNLDIYYIYIYMYYTYTVQMIRCVHFAL